MTQTNIKRLADVLNADDVKALGGELVVPMVNINGTSARSLVGGYLEVTNKVHEALMELQGLLPNGRDYPSRPDLLDRATRQHRLRQGALRAVLEEVLTLASLTASGRDDTPRPPGWDSVEA